MDFVSLLSGGKDSCYNTFLSIQHGHRLVCLAHLCPPPQTEVECEETNSFMYQSAGSSVIRAYEECFGVPMIQRVIQGRSVDTSLEYSQAREGDEVEDMFELLKSIKETYPTIKAVACGAILSNYQRHRLEHVCSRLNLTVLAYLWQKDRAELLDEMVFQNNMHITLVKVAGAGLEPRKHLGKSLRDLAPTLRTLNAKYGLDLCGEGGEYESLVLDAPFFLKRIEIVASQIVEDTEDYQVGNLYVKEWRVVSKDSNPSDAEERKSPLQILHASLQQAAAYAHVTPESGVTSDQSLPATLTIKPAKGRILLPAKVHMKQDGFGNTELIYPVQSIHTLRSTSTAEETTSAVVAQITEVMERLQQCLLAHQIALHDIVFVHLYLSDLRHFVTVNDIYCRYFGTHPPSRSCVGMIQPLGVFVALDATILRNSYQSMTPVREVGMQPIKRIREVLHVQSLSQWAPLCIGPYAQANMVHDFLIFVAGQIPLVPGTMTLRSQTSLMRGNITGEDTFTPGTSEGGHNITQSTHPAHALALDLALALQHVQRILQVQLSSLRQLASVVLYLNTPQLQQLARQAQAYLHPGTNAEEDAIDVVRDMLATECRVLLYNLIRSNMKTPKKTLENSEDEGDEYADDVEEENEDQSAEDDQDFLIPPILVVGVCDLPRGALLEIETMATRSQLLCSSRWRHDRSNVSQQTVENYHHGCTVGPISEMLDNWPMWQSASTTVHQALAAFDEIRGEVECVSYPGCLSAGLVRLSRHADADLLPSLNNYVARGVSALQRVLREKAHMRSSRLLAIRLYYDPVHLLGLSPQTDGEHVNYHHHFERQLVALWQEQWRTGHEVNLQQPQGTKSAVSLSVSPSSLDEHMSRAEVIALPATLFRDTSVVDGTALPVLQVQYLALDAHQLETETWVALAK